MKPPDLGGTDFRLPTLRNQNIFEGDAFDSQPSWAERAYSARYDWVVGNPPWKELTSDSLESSDTHVFEWMKGHHRERPTGGNQVAEAFAWRACDFVADDGVVGLLLPAMTLFKYESEKFRAKFLQHAQLWSVANFSNLAEILFAGRSRVPAAAFFYSCAEGAQQPESVEFYSPLVANQVLHNPGGPGTRKQVWAIVVNTSEIRDVPYRDVRAGAFLPWKIAFWGGSQDQYILRALGRRRLRTLGELHRSGVISIAQGFELRTGDPESPDNGLEAHPELSGKLLLNTAALQERRFVFRFPAEVLTSVSPDRIYVRKRGGFEKPLRVCNPPHIIVSAARNFAVYSDGFVVIPPRQIGIAAQSEDAGFLVALALYLNSDFVTYHQFFTAPEFGIKRSRGTLKALRMLPVPFEPTSSENWSAWKELHDRLLAAEVAGVLVGNPHWYAEGHGAELLAELNTLVNRALGLDKRAQAAVRDLVHLRRALVDGQVGEAAVRLPEREELQAYVEALQAELDGILEGDIAARHRVTVVHDANSGMVEVDLVRQTETKQPVAVLEADDPSAREFQKVRDRLREKRSQWIYFDRNLRIYEDTRTYLFKPLQRLHWTESQAIADAGEIIADTLEPAPRDDTAHLVAR